MNSAIQKNSNRTPRAKRGAQTRLAKRCTITQFVAAILLLFAGLEFANAQQTITQADLLQQLIARDALFAPPTSGETWHAVSSRSKTKNSIQANNGLRFRAKNGDDFILADIRGPGVLSRLWTLQPTGTLRIECDDQVVFDDEFANLFQQNEPPFEIPFAFRIGEAGAGVCVFPIGFNNRLRITGRDITQPYAIEYRQYGAESTDVAPFAAELNEETREVYDAVKKSLLNGFTPDEIDAEQKILPIAIHDSLAHSAMITDEIDGSGVIRALYFAVTQRADPLGTYALHKCVLRIYFDGEEEPSVEVPLIDFFASPLVQQPVSSLLAGTDMMLDIPLPDRRLGRDRYAYCYFPMPFRDGMRFELLNFSGEEMDVLIYLRVARQDVPANALRFHAKHVVANPLVRSNLAWCDTRGPGRLVGLSLGVDTLANDWLTSTTPLFAIDGRRAARGASAASLLGVTENPFRLQTGLSAVSLADETTKLGAARWFAFGGVPFERQLLASLQLDRSGGRKDDFLSAVAYWYAPATGKDNFARIRSESLEVPGLRFENAVEIEGRVRDGLGRIVSDDRAREVEYSEGRAVRLPEDKPVRIAIPLLEPQQVELKLRLHPRRRFERITIRSVEGNEQAEISFRERANGLYSLGDWNLTSGSNLVEVVATGSVIADCWVLAEQR